MGIEERKKREFAEREARMIAAADGLLAKGGYLGLNLDELARGLEYSKGTLYQHFSSKEDLVLAVANHHMSIRAEYFERASAFNGKTRERMFAFGIGDFLLARRFPHGFPIGQLVRTESIWAKCSEARQAEFFKHSGRVLELGFALAEKAEENGDLKKWSPSPRQIIWGIVSISKGAHLLSDNTLLPDQDENEVLGNLFDNYHRFLDGAGWKPSSRSFDYDRSKERIENELFAEEIAALSQ